MRHLAVPLGVLSTLITFIATAAAWPGTLAKAFVPPASLDQIALIEERAARVAVPLLAAFVVICALLRRGDPFVTRAWYSSAPATLLILTGCAGHLWSTDRDWLTSLRAGEPTPTQYLTAWLALSALALVALSMLTQHSQPAVRRRR